MAEKPKTKKPKQYDPAAARLEATRLLIGNYDEWPRWPLLPMRNIQRGLHRNDCLGIMTEEDDDKYNIYIQNMYHKITDKTPIESFDSVDDLINAGWRVD